MAASITSGRLPLQGVRVVEVSEGIGAAFAGRWLHLLGAEVVRIEPPEGASMRHAEPRFSAPGGPRSTLFEFLNQGKRSVVRPADPAATALRGLLESSDILLHDWAPNDPRSHAGTAEAFPHLVVTAVRGFGTGDEYTAWQATDLTAYAMGGMVYITGAGDREPLKHGLTQAEFAAAEHAVIGILAALVERARSGRGQEVEATLLEAVASLIFVQTAQYSYTGEVTRRLPVGGGGFGSLQVVKTKDGYVAPVLGQGGTWSELVELLQDDALRDPEFESPAARRRLAARVDPLMEAAMARHTSRDLFVGAQQRRLAFGLCQDAADLLACEQHEARGFFQSVALGDRVLSVPGLPFLIGGRRGASLSAAPDVGADQALLDDLGPKRAAPPGAPDPASRAPLDGIRVLEAGMMYAAPMAARMLGDYGADVVKVESARRLDGIRSLGSPPDNEVTARFYDECSRFNDSNRNKRAISLDITAPGGRDLFLRLAADSDIVIENFTTGTMDRLGLGFEAVRAVNPRVIYIATTGYGQTGPWAAYRAQGQSLEPAFGLAHLTGYPDGGPMRCGMTYSDVTAARAGAIAALAALLLRDATGEAVYVDLSQYEEGTALVTEALMERQVSGRTPSRIGNRDTRYAPQGVYPCVGDDEWVAVTVRNDADWAALVDSLGDDLLRAPRYASVSARHAHHDEIDEAIGRWTSARSKQDATRVLQRAGVPAGPVNRPDEVLLDPHLRARGFYWRVDHGDVGGRLGTRHYTGPVAVLSRTPATVRYPAPAFGEHSREVLSERLGLADADLAALEESRVMSADPVLSDLRPMVLADPARSLETRALQRIDAGYRERVARFFGDPT